MGIFDEAEINAAADRAEIALNGQFSQIYKELRALTPEEIDDITPDATDQKEYERLIALVQEATVKNLEQAELINRVRALGEVGLKIARKVPTLTPFLPGA